MYKKSSLSMIETFTTGTPIQGLTQPQPPTNIVVTPGNASITVSWTPSISPNVSGYYYSITTTTDIPTSSFYNRLSTEVNIITNYTVIMGQIGNVMMFFLENA